MEYRSIISHGGWGVLSFDLPVRQAQGPEALEGEALDRWYGVGLFICHCRWGLRRNPAG